MVDLDDVCLTNVNRQLPALDGNIGRPKVAAIAEENVEGKPAVGSLLLGLYDDSGLLHHVGFTSMIPKSEKKLLTAKLEKLIAPPGFTGRAPGGPSRWSTTRSGEWQPLRPKLVVEVQYDHFTGGRFRHGTRLLRWRPDKSPRSCTMKQVAQESAVSPLKLMSA